MSSQSTMAIQGFQVPRERVWSLIRPLERLASLAALILLSPLMLFVAAVIAVLSRRAPLIGVLRTGQFGAPLWTFKFRTMWPGEAENSRRAGVVEYIVDESGPESKSSGDPRITSKFARLCRRFSIDELPQLINVLRGEMSLVAPRPLTQGELIKHYGFDAVEVLRVKPGITGLWQVAGRSRLSYGERREMDLFLVRNRGSLKLYFTILRRTIPAVLKGQDGW
jgi:exopolysaccharide production protein ExoY